MFGKFWLELSKIYYLLICDYLATGKSIDHCGALHTSVDCLRLISVFPQLVGVYKQYLKKKIIKVTSL